MTDPVSITAEQLTHLSQQHWRRLGITQTFDSLLVKAAAVTPGTADSVRDTVSQSLSGGAVKFWELSYPSLLKDLSRRGVLSTEEGVQLSPDFADRLQRIIGDQEAGVSHVDPTPGVTLESVLAKAKRREASAKVTSKARPRATKAKAKAAATPKAEAAPIKRAPATKPEPSAPAAAPVAAAPVVPSAPLLAPVNKLFTSLKVNRLLDSLDNARLLKSQLGGRLDLGGANFERFIEISDRLEITRTTSDGQVELHWKGRELARTTSAERRMALIELVRELRSAAEATE